MLHVWQLSWNCAPSEALTKLVTRRALEQRKDTTPTLAERINNALRIDRPRVGAWGSASAVGSAVDQNAPAPAQRKGTPEPPVR